MLEQYELSALPLDVLGNISCCQQLSVSGMNLRIHYSRAIIFESLLQLPSMALDSCTVYRLL